MKSGIHPQVHDDATCTCSTCNAVFKVPSTVQEQSVEVCMYCHPVYTGKAQQDMKSDRVQKFRERMAAAKK